jgi:hypothetical protein
MDRIKDETIDQLLSGYKTGMDLEGCMPAIRSGPLPSWRCRRRLGLASTELCKSVMELYTPGQDFYWTVFSVGTGSPLTYA